jgi:hypothetical protein
MVERGSEPHGRIQVKGGKFDGAFGVVEHVEWVEGARHVHVMLDSGEQIVTVQPRTEKADTPIPRELGSL